MSEGDLQEPHGDPRRCEECPVHFLRPVVLHAAADVAAQEEGARQGVGGAEEGEGRGQGLPHLRAEAGSSVGAVITLFFAQYKSFRNGDILTCDRGLVLLPLDPLLYDVREDHVPIAARARDLSE